MKISGIATAVTIGALAVTPALAQTSATPQPSTQTSNAQVPGALSTNMVQRIQTRLQQQGLYRGKVDGVWGPETRTAVRDFQQAHGLRPTGLIDSQTMADLQLGGPGQAQYSVNQNAPAQNTAGTNPNPGSQQNYNGPNTVQQEPATTANPLNSGPTIAKSAGAGGL